MRSFLLLILSLMTGCGASFEVKGCPGGWIEFTCKCPKQCANKHIVLHHPKLKSIPITQKDKWETTGNISLYHDTKKKLIKVAIKHLKEEDFGDYRCQIDKTTRSSGSSEEKHDSRTSTVEVVKRGDCWGQFLQTAYRTARTTITCDHPKNESKSSVKFFCKEKGDSICEEILSTESSPESNRTFSLTETNSSLSMSISNVSSEDAGVYWCGVKSNNGRNRIALRKIQLVVENITDLMRFPAAGRSFTYSCEYPISAPINRFICKGEDPSICERLVSTAQRGNTGKFSVQDKRFGNMTITVRDITTDDTGTYWCGAESTNNRHSNPFFSRLMMTVVSPTKSLNESADSYGSWLTVIIAAVVCVTLLVLVLILVLVYKRFDRPKTTNEEAQNKEDGTYEEIPELPPKPQPGTAMKTIYATADLPIYPSPAPHHHSYINFHYRSALVGANIHPTVRDKNQQGPTNSTVNQPPKFPAGPLYSTVNLPQQH